MPCPEKKNDQRIIEAIEQRKAMPQPPVETYITKTLIGKWPEVMWMIPPDENIMSIQKVDEDVWEVRIAP